MLKMEGEVDAGGGATFAKPVGWWRSRRQMLAEEGQAHWAQVATVYRALRKSFEDSKNEAGAGDFYCGEMECRRLGSPSGLWCSGMIRSS